MKRNIFAVLALAFAALSCSEGGSNCLTCPDTVPTVPRDSIAPQVVSVSPEDGAGDVPVTTAIVVTFSESVDPTTVNVVTFKVMNGDQPVAGSAKTGSPTATFTPTDSLEFLTTYTAVLSGVKDTAGNVLAEEYRWSFTTMEDPTLWALDEGLVMTDLAVDEEGWVYARGYDPSGPLFVAGFDHRGKNKWVTLSGRFNVLPIGLVHNCGYVYSIRPEGVQQGGVGGERTLLDKFDRRTGELMWSVVVSDQLSTGSRAEALAAGESCVVHAGVIEHHPNLANSVSYLKTVSPEGEIIINSFLGDSVSIDGVAAYGGVVYVSGTLWSGGYFLDSYELEGMRLNRTNRILYEDKTFAGRGLVGVSGDRDIVYLVGGTGNIPLKVPPKPVVRAHTLAGEFLWEVTLGERAGEVWDIWVSKDGSLYSLLSATGFPIFKTEPSGQVPWISENSGFADGIAVLGDTVFTTAGARLALYDARDGSRIR